MYLGNTGSASLFTPFSEGDNILSIEDIFFAMSTFVVDRLRDNFLLRDAGGEAGDSAGVGACAGADDADAISDDDVADVSMPSNSTVAMAHCKLLTARSRDSGMRRGTLLTDRCRFISR